MTEFSFRTRQQNLLRLANEEFDLLVIGGGIHGAGVARDAALRGLKVALVEKGDYASGTSSKSSKLIHGGLRYLEQFDLGLVRESCRERETLMRIAPHLVKPLRFVIPIYNGDRPAWMVRIGLTMYDALSMFRNVHRHRMLSVEEALSAEPSLRKERLRGAAEYWDCQENDARFCLANIIDAGAHGAVCVNYTEVIGFGTIITVRDNVQNDSIEVRAKSVVNAGGPWVDRIASLDTSSSPIRLRRTKGVHVVTKRLTTGHALLLQTKEDRRIFFVLPWGANHSLIGTTDTDFQGNTDHVEAENTDVEYLLNAVNHCLPEAKIAGLDVLATFAGLRPLLQQSGRTPSDVTRRHELKISPQGMISIVGGKYTTYRAVAEEVVNLLSKRMRRSTPSCRTSTEPLAPELPANLDEMTLINAVRHAVEHEMTLSAGDFLFRRTILGYMETGDGTVAQLVADEMQKHLGWTEDEKSRQLRRLM